MINEVGKLFSDRLLVLFPRGYFEVRPATAVAWQRMATALARCHFKVSSLILH